MLDPVRPLYSSRHSYARSVTTNTWLLYLPLGTLLLAVLGEIRRVPLTRVESLVVQSRRLLTIPDEATVEVTIDGRKVQGASITIVRLTNTGKTALSSDSWESPLEIELPNGELISARQIAARPTGLRVSIEALPDRARIAPFLFNPGDIFDIQLVCENLTTDPVAHARIKDVKGIKRRRRAVYNPGNGPDGMLDTSSKVVYFAIFPAMFLFLGMVFLFAPSEPGVKLIGGALVAGLLILQFTFLRWAVRRSRRWRPEERF